MLVHGHVSRVACRFAQCNPLPVIVSGFHQQLRALTRPMSNLYTTVGRYYSHVRKSEILFGFGF